MKTRLLLISILLITTGTLRVSGQVFDQAMQIIGGGTKGLTEGDAAGGIREALEKGTLQAVGLVSKTDGYFRSPEIKIPFPNSAKQIESTLRSAGLGGQVDEAVLSINRAAEDAAKSAAPIFTDAIKKMSISDAVGIVKGQPDAATRYLERTTSADLKSRFTPVIKASLDKVNATRYWADLVKAYNQIPFVAKQNPDLTAYATDMAIKGLFTMIAKEEQKIRKDPAAQTTELLKKVFGGK